MTELNSSFQIQHLRSATAKITYAGKVFLLDPVFAKKDEWPGFKGSLREHIRNPTVELPISIEEILDNLDAVIVTHTHLDHWDEAAQKLIPKNLPIFAQNKADAALIRSQGFIDVRDVSAGIEFEGISLYPTGGQHGTDAMYANEPLGTALGDAMGLVFQAPNMKTVYFVGDTTWQPQVTQAINDFQPDIIVLNAGYAQWRGYEGSLIMGKDDVLKASLMCPGSKIVAVHLEGINHCMLSRAELAEYAKEHHVTNVLIPQDGEVLRFSH